MTPLFDSLETLVATLASSGPGTALTTDEAIDLLHDLLFGLDQMMTEEGLWDRLAAETGFRTWLGRSRHRPRSSLRCARA